MQSAKRNGANGLKPEQVQTTRIKPAAPRPIPSRSPPSDAQ